MELFENLILIETEKRANDEIKHAIKVINTVYKDWKNKKRRKNAVDLITSSVNKLNNLAPSLVDKIHDAGKIKLTTIIMRCMDNPTWKPLSSKEKIYKKLYPLIDRLQNDSPQSVTTGSLREVIMSRLSACISAQYECEDDKRVYVAYEPKMSKRYLTYIFGDKVPVKTYRMQSLPLPESYETLIDTLNINHDKCVAKFSESDD